MHFRLIHMNLGIIHMNLGIIHMNLGIIHMNLGIIHMNPDGRVVRRELKGSSREVGGWGRVPFSKKLMSPTPRRKWYLTTGRRDH